MVLQELSTKVKEINRNVHLIITTNLYEKSNLITPFDFVDSV